MAGAATIAGALRRATLALHASATARLDAEVLLARVLELTRSDLYREPETRIAAAAIRRFDRMVAERALGVPVAYLTGRVEFWSLDLEISRDVLVPRPDTELLVEIALDHAPAGAGVLADLGTGSGAIALALARERAGAVIVATDRSHTALAVAARNIARLGLPQVRLVQGDWLRPFADDCFDLIVSNPPYIAAAERAALGPGLAFEPAVALYAGDTGLADLEAIIEQAASRLRAGGWLALEHGAGQAAAVAVRLRGRGYVDIETRRDLAGHERVTLGRRV